VQGEGVVCHLGNRSCFTESIPLNNADALTTSERV
jgi:hypothetical protein